MSQDDLNNPSETVIRLILRLPRETTGAFARLHQDSDDFERRRDYRGTGKPENGLSLLRKEKFNPLPGIYDYVKGNKWIGSSECTIEQLRAKNLQFIVTGNNEEHISLRCPTCNLSKDPNEPCKPKDGKSPYDCPFFQDDPFDLNRIFEEIDAPSPRSKKPWYKLLI